MGQFVDEFLTFFTTVDPISTLAVFVGLTAAAQPGERERIARRAVGYSAVILVSFIVIGQLALGSIGIRLVAFQISGAIIFFLFGLQMVFGVGAGAASPSSTEGEDLAVYPLAVPSIASPGAILAAVVLTDNREFTIAEQAITTCLLLAVLGITYLVLLQSTRIYGILGNAGCSLLVRIMGMVLAGLAVEMFLEALDDLALE